MAVGSKRDNSIDTLRGIAALLLVAFHAVEPGQPVVRAQFSYDYFGYSFELLRMPLFTVISGFVYAMRPVRPESWAIVRKFLAGKARRLLLPLLTTIAIVLSLRRVMGREPEASASLSEIAGYFVFSYEVYWFLQGLLWVFVLIVALERFGALSTPKRFVLTLAATALIGPLIPGSDLFSWWASRYLAPFFILGLGLKRFESAWDNKGLLLGVAMVALGALGLQQANWWFDLGISTNRMGPLSFVTGLSCSFVLVRTRFGWPALAKIGEHSYAIYLYHLMGISVGARLAEKFGFVQNDHPAFFAKLIFGVGLSAAAEVVLLRFDWGRRFFLGLRSAKKGASKTAPSAGAVG